MKTWGDALDYTFQTRHTWRHGTGAKTARINSNHFTRLRGLSFPISKITNPVLNQVAIELEEEGKSDATINRVISAVSTVIRHIAFDGLIDRAPQFRRRKEGESRLTWYTKEEVEGLVYASLDPYERADLADIIVSAGYTGMRKGELLKLKCRDVDFRLNVIHVGGRPDVQTKARNYRSVPIHDRIADLLMKRVTDAAPHKHVFGSDWTNPDQLLRAFRKVRNFCGHSEKHCFHTLRHSYGTWLAEKGVPLLTIRDLMGHKRIETTMLYSKVTDTARNDAVALI